MSETGNAPDRWKPVLKGDIYCSPGCGCRCTKAAYDVAVEKAEELAKKLGAPWVSRVHENGNWFWGATIPGKEYDRIIAGPSLRRDNYWVSIKIAGIGQVCGNYDDPVAGLADCLRSARESANAALAELDEMPNRGTTP